MVTYFNQIVHVSCPLARPVDRGGLARTFERPAPYPSHDTKISEGKDRGGSRDTADGVEEFFGDIVAEGEPNRTAV